MNNVCFWNFTIIFSILLHKSICVLIGHVNVVKLHRLSCLSCLLARQIYRIEIPQPLGYSMIFVMLKDTVKEKFSSTGDVLMFWNGSNVRLTAANWLAHRIIDCNIHLDCIPSRKGKERPYEIAFFSVWVVCVSTFLTFLKIFNKLSTKLCPLGTLYWFIYKFPTIGNKGMFNVGGTLRECGYPQQRFHDGQKLFAGADCG